MSGFERFESAGKRARYFEPKSLDLASQLRDLLGPIDEQQMQTLLPLAQKSLETAVNAYFDGVSTPNNQIRDGILPDRSLTPNDSDCTLFVASDHSDETPPPQPAVEQRNELLNSVKTEHIPSSRSVHSSGQSRDSPDISNRGPPAPPLPAAWPRSIGTFETALWVTRSGRSPQYGDKLFLKRVASKNKDDHIVRVLLGEEFGPELARVAEADAKFIAPLMDAGITSYTGSVVFCDLPLRTGDTVWAQFNVFIEEEAFTVPLLDNKLDQKAKNMEETQESNFELLMGLRQQALNRLFGRVGLISKDLSKQSDSQLREVTKNQLDMVYENSVKAELQEREPANTFAFDLYPYQRKALYWMSQRENDLKDVDDTLHPLWTELRWTDGDLFYANLNSGELALKKPTMTTAGMGGILADEMGLGKTIQILSLIHTSRPKMGPTLIVAPMSLLNQWQRESIKSAVNKTQVDAQIYYGPGLEAKLKSCVDSCHRKAGIVITSYGVLASEYKNFLQRPSSSPLFQTKFDRVVLDEAHTIKNKNTIAAKAASNISAVKRWAVTGTPVINRLEDLYSLIKFLGVQPWNHFSFWSAFITKPFENGDAESALKTVQSIVDPICLRRTKDMKHNGKPLVELPDKVVEIKRLKFTEAEQDLYFFMFSRVRTSVQDSMDQGTATKKMASLLYQILRLRQICCHPMLLRKPQEEGDEGSLELATGHPPELEELLEHFYKIPRPQTRLLDTYSSSIVSQVIEASEQAECAICFEPVAPTKQALTPCYHMACIDCILQFVEHSKRKKMCLKCPMCREEMDSKDLLIVDKIDGKTVLREYVENHQSTKIRALIDELRTNGGNGKNVVFSQFTSFLDLIAPELEYFGFKVLKVDGRLSMLERGIRLDKFKETEGNIVLLLSLKVGGVGLNLTCANQVFMMDPWWNFATESQAIDRIHRMGQTSTTRVVRFIVEGSIEERMLKIQERKDALSAVVSADEKKSNTMEDIKLLFDLESKSA